MTPRRKIMNTKLNAILNKDHAAAWKPFVAEYARLMTATKANAELTNGYRVVKVGAKYEIRFGALKPYSPMDAGTLYDWMQRLPLKYWSDEADTLRYHIMTN
jgi:hypothetical protein